uniref:Transmembrane protein n=1 Tax=Trypanosoma vivax (strain Y486) TaxID=1055687 RepID=G0TY19_TRYVY|nr:hypothetical protein TVY486_0702010 [Trypanosoma vivax Y486]
MGDERLELGGMGSNFMAESCGVVAHGRPCVNDRLISRIRTSTIFLVALCALCVFFFFTFFVWCTPAGWDGVSSTVPCSTFSHPFYCVVCACGWPPLSLSVALLLFCVFRPDIHRLPLKFKPTCCASSCVCLCVQIYNERT